MIRRVQAPAGGTSAGAGAAVTLNLTTTKANEAVIVLVFSGTTTAPTVTDNLGHVYVEDATHNASTNWRVGIWSYLGKDGGITSVTVTPPASNYALAFVGTYQGLKKSGAFDQTAAADTVSSTNYSSGNTPTLSQAEELCVGLAVGGTKGAGGTYGLAASGSWVNPAIEVDIATDDDGGRWQELIVNSTAPIAATGTNTAGGFTAPGISAIVATYKADTSPASVSIGGLGY